MKKQKKLLLSAFSFMLALSFFVVGVYSALVNTGWTINGKVSFDVDDISGKFGVYEGRVLDAESDPMIAYYNKASVEEKDFADTSKTDWELTESYTSFTRTNQSYFYHVVIRNTDVARMYVYFEVHNSLFTQETPNWMNASSFAFIHENDDENILNENAFTQDGITGALKLFSVLSETAVSTFPDQIATEYDESGLNYIGQGSNANYRKFSLRLEGGQTLSLMNIFYTNIANATSEDRGAQFTIANAISVDLDVPQIV